LLTLVFVGYCFFCGTSGGTNAKVSEWCTRGLLDREVVMMTPILEMRHTTPMHERRRSLSRPRSLFGGLDNNNNNSGGAVHQDDRTARLAGGVVAVQSKSGHAQRALYVVGGTSLLLPLFAQLEPPPAALGGGGGGEGTVGAADGAADGAVDGATDAVSDAKEKSVGGGNEFDEAFELMMFVLTLVMGESGDVLMNEMEQLQTIIPTISVLCKICGVNAVGDVDDAAAVIDRSFFLLLLHAWYDCFFSAPLPTKGVDVRFFRKCDVVCAGFVASETKIGASSDSRHLVGFQSLEQKFL